MNADKLFVFGFNGVDRRQFVAWVHSIYPLHPWLDRFCLGRSSSFDGLPLFLKPKSFIIYLRPSAANWFCLDRSSPVSPASVARNAFILCLDPFVLCPCCSWAGPLRGRILVESETEIEKAIAVGVRAGGPFLHALSGFFTLERGGLRSPGSW